MLFSKAAIFTTATTLAGLVSAQTTGTGQAKVHTVQVGDKDGGLKFYPEQLDAAVGDMVRFQFYPKSHSVARSAFTNPCVPLDPATANGTSSFFSGFVPVQQVDKFMPTFTILINETTPIWYYCATGKHCQNGMAGVINPPKQSTDRTLAKYKQAAVGATTVAPGTSFGGETDPDGPEGPKLPLSPNNTTTTPTRTGTSTGTSTGTTSPTSTEGGASSLLASGATVVLGAVAVAALLV